MDNVVIFCDGDNPKQRDYNVLFELKTRNEIEASTVQISTTNNFIVTNEFIESVLETSKRVKNLENIVFIPMFYLDFYTNDIYEFTSNTDFPVTASTSTSTSTSTYMQVRKPVYIIKSTEKFTKKATIKHWENLSEKMNSTNTFFNLKGIVHGYVSNDIQSFKDRFTTMYNLKTDNYQSAKKIVVFGVYSIRDIEFIKKYSKTAEIHVIFGGSDIDNRFEASRTLIPQLQSCNIHTYYSISKSIYDRIKSTSGMDSSKTEHLNLSFVPKNIFSFYDFPSDEFNSNKIFVYDGSSSSKPEIYNKELLEKIHEKLSSKYTFIYNSQISVPNEQMPEIYRECFMGIRLCPRDGNANSVQEMGLLGIPVLHNGSFPNSVKFNSTDINLMLEKIQYIWDNMRSKKIRKIISESVLAYIDSVQRKTMCIYVPIWGRHSTVTKNVHLLSHQTYTVQQVIIVLVYSTDEDKELCINLSERSGFSNVYMCKVENRPLSKKYQFGLEFCKLFYPKGVTINGSDDFLSLNYIEKVSNIFDQGYNYTGTSSWFVGDLSPMLLYKFSYTDPQRLVGCGRSFKHTLLEDMEWSIFPLNRDSGIDNASDTHIENFSVLKPIDQVSGFECFTFSFKDGDDMITTMSNLLKSVSSKHRIVNSSELIKIMFDSSLESLIKVFKRMLVPETTNTFHNSFLFVTMIDNISVQRNPVVLNSSYMSNVLKQYFDVIDLRKLGSMKVYPYSLIFIDAISLNLRTTGLSKNEMFSLLDMIKHVPKVLICHDLHDYTYDFNNGCHPTSTELSMEKLTYSTQLSERKKEFIEFIKVNKIEYLLSIYDCPEYDCIVKYSKDVVRKFYLTNHHVPRNIFHPIKVQKDIDILIYGWTNSNVYPFRDRLKNIIVGLQEKIGIKVCIVERNESMPIEKDLAVLINRSWISVATLSNFSYLVRKYFEIASCRSVPLGPLNNQGKSIFNGLTLEVSDTMSDEELENFITTSLDNKELLVLKSTVLAEKMKSFNFNMFMKTLLEISDDIRGTSGPSTRKHDYNTVKTIINKKSKLSLNCINQMNETTIECGLWSGNQNVDVQIDINGSVLTRIKQESSTPGIKCNVTLESGTYLFRFIQVIEENLDIELRVYCFNDMGSSQIQVIENCINGLHVAQLFVRETGMYNLMILSTKPIMNSKFKVDQFKLFKM